MLPQSQAGQQGEWLKTYEPIEPENIVGAQVFKSMNESADVKCPECKKKTMKRVGKFKHLRCTECGATKKLDEAEKLDEIGAALAGAGRALGAAGKAVGKAVGGAVKNAATQVATATELAQQAKTTGDKEEGALTQYKHIDDLAVGDDIEVIDIDGDPAAVTVKTPRGPGDTLVVQTDKGEEHIVKKQAVSGTPVIQEMREMYEKALNESVETEPCTWCNATGVDEWGDTCFSCGGLGEVTLDGEYAGVDEDSSYESALTDRVHEAYNANKTEHSGAKKGKGGYHGRKKDAKRDSNKKRRANDKKEINEEPASFDFEAAADALIEVIESLGLEVNNITDGKYLYGNPVIRISWKPIGKHNPRYWELPMQVRSGLQDHGP